MAMSIIDGTILFVVKHGDKVQFLALLPTASHSFQLAHLWN